jgi:hypothetical protein
MKKLFAIVLAAFALSAFAAEPVKTPATPAKPMLLAKKKDHSKDAKPKQAPAKSPSKKAETSKK